MSEQPTRAQHLQSIRQAFASAPPTADAQGKTDVDRQLDTERTQRVDAWATGQPAPTAPAVPPAGMRPNPAQGRASIPEHTVPTRLTGTPGENIRARIVAAGDAAFDDGSSPRP